MFKKALWSDDRRHLIIIVDQDAEDVRRVIRMVSAVKKSIQFHNTLRSAFITS